MHEITNVFQNYMAPRVEMDRFDVAGRELLEHKFKKFMDAELPIQFTLLGYPFKSINDRDKTLGILPDLGEELSMLNFKSMADDIQSVYKPGMKLTIVSDGYMFNHLMQVPDKTVEQYNEVVKDMASIAPIEVLDARDFYPGKPLDEVREKVMQQFGISDIELEQRIMFDPEVRELYKGMIRFMHDDLAIWKYDSGNQLHKAAKKMARQMMHWNEAYSLLIRTQLTEPLGAIRLSMHPSQNAGTKYSINLINAESHQSPWHSCIVMINGKPVTMKRKDAEQQGYTLIFKNSQPYNYEA